MARISQFDTQMLRDWYTVSEAMVYWYLWRISRKTRECSFSPSIWLMVKSLNLCKRTIIRWIEKLERDWLIDVFREYKTKNTYLIRDMDKYPAINDFDRNKMWGLTKRDKQKKIWWQNVTRWWQNDTR